MFDSTNTTYFEEQAKYDQQFVKYKDSTGIYQCYCQKYGNFFKSFFNRFDLCAKYYYYFGGTIDINIPAGMIIGIINAISAKIIQTLVPRIGLHSRTSELSLKVMSMFLMAYLNISLFIVLEGNHYNWNSDKDPQGLS